MLKRILDALVLEHGGPKKSAARVARLLGIQPSRLAAYRTPEPEGPSTASLARMADRLGTDLPGFLALHEKLHAATRTPQAPPTASGGTLRKPSATRPLAGRRSGLRKKAGC